MAELPTPSVIPYLLILILVAVVLYSSIRIAQENERFAVFTMGRFVRYKGPGLVLKSAMTQLIRLRVGDIGMLTSHEFARFGDVDVPVTNVDSFRAGDSVRIDGFDDTGPRLVKSSVHRKTHCPNCGHEF